MAPYIKFAKKRETQRKSEKTGGKHLNNEYSNQYVFGESDLQREKSEIRQRSMYIGLAMLITLAAQVFWSVAYFNVMRLFGIDNDAAIEIAQRPIVNQLINQILSAIIFTLPFLVVTSGCQLKHGDIASYKKPDKEFLLPIIFISISFFAFANMASSVVTNIFAGFGKEVTGGTMPETTGIFGFIVTFIGAAVVAPLTEEFAMRGVVLGALRKYGDGFALLVSALLFGLMHGNFMQIPFAFVVGLALGFAVIKTRSVWTGVIIHFINNATAVILETASRGLPQTAKALINTGYFCLCFACLFIGILLLKGETKKLCKLTSCETGQKPQKIAGYFFSGFFMIAYLVLITFTAMGNLK